MTIDALPPAATRSDSPDEFIAKEDAWRTAMPIFGEQVNAAALAMNLNATSDTSASSVAIGTGAKTFTVSAGKSFLGGMFLVIADTAAPSTNYMFGQITSYSGTSLVVNVLAIGGSGTKAAWTISQSAPIEAWGESTGVVKDYIGTVAPTGYVLASGRTIGNAASGATERANDDTEALFTLLWDSMANAEAPVSSGRGASAAADFAANKTITLPDARGRVIAGKDNMGGATASRLTSAGSGILGTTLGISGGTQTHTLITAEMPAHTHSNGANYASNTSAGGSGFYASSTSTNTGSQGGGGAHQNTQPTLVLNKIIKL